MRAAVGLAQLPETIAGSWPFETPPERVRLLGRDFRRSDTWAAPRAGVVAQYREEVDRGSMHLMVHDDGTWSIDHTDDANPERGLVLEHAFRDALHTPVGAALFAGGVVLLVAGVAWLATRR